MRIELTQPAWKAGVLPLNYTRVKGVFIFLGLIFKSFLWWRGKDRTFEDRSQRVYSPPHLTALVPLQIIIGMNFDVLILYVLIKINRNKAMKSFMILGKYPVIEAIKSKSERLLKVYILGQNTKYLQTLNYRNFEIVDKKFFKKSVKIKILYIKDMLLKFLKILWTSKN